MSRRLFLSSIWLTMLRALGVGVQALNVLFLARILPISDVGAYAVTYALLGMVRFIGPLGTDQTILREIAGGSTTEADRKQRLADTSLSVTLLSATICAVLIICYLNFGVEGADVNMISGAAIAISCVLYSAMGSLIPQIRGMGFNLRAQVPEALLTHIVFGLLILVGAANGSLSFDYLTVALAIAMAATVGTYLVFRRMVGFRGLMLPRISELFGTLSEAKSSFFALMLTVAAGRVPIVTASTFGGAPAGAILDVSSRFGSMASLTTNSVGATFSPQLAKQARMSSASETRKTLLTACLAAAVPAWSWLIVLICGAPFAIGTILPATYQPAIAPMIAIGLAYALNASLGPSTNFLFMSGRAKVVAWFSAGQLVTLIIAGLASYPHFGLLGIAGSMCLGSLVRDGGSMFYSLIILHQQDRTPFPVSKMELGE